MSILIDGVSHSKLGRIPKDGEKSSQFILVKLLTGNSTISNTRTILNQRTDYSSLPPAETSSSISEFLTSYGIGGTTQKFIKNTISDNRNFYSHILNEFSNYFLQTKLGAHTSAFVFLYRILEQLSFTAPLLYCSTQKDYMGTFEDLRKIFDPQLKGELGLFKKFLNEGKFIDALKLDILYAIKFNSSRNYQEKYFSTTKKHSKEFTSEDKTRFELEIKFRDVPSLIINIRNRFFHSATGNGRDNIKIREILDPDEYFSCLNKTFCSVLAIIVLHTIASKYQT
jgi:hypothetical protein